MRGKDQDSCGNEQLAASGGRDCNYQFRVRLGKQAAGFTVNKASRSLQHTRVPARQLPFGPDGARNWNRFSEADPKFRGHRKNIFRHGGMNHHLVEHRRDNAPVDNVPVALKLFGRSEFREYL